MIYNYYDKNIKKQDNGNYPDKCKVVYNYYVKL